MKKLSLYAFMVLMFCNVSFADNLKIVDGDTIVLNGESLSSFLVRSGYAFAYRKYSKKFIKEEEFAKENKLGMWSMEFEYPWDFRKT